MLSYAVRRLLLTIALVIGLSVLLFFYLQAIPGDPVAGLLGSEGNPELIAQLRHEFGLDRPLPVQYWDWLSGIPQGDLGISLSSRQPIGPVLIDRIPATLQLTFASLFVALLIGLPTGFLAALFKDTWLDRAFVVSALAGLSMPVFMLGTLLVYFVAVRLDRLPSQGYVPLSEDPVESLRLTILPALTLGLAHAPYIARMVRAATIEVQQEPFVIHAQAKGLSRRRVVLRYSARNALIPVLIILSLQLGSLLSGQVIVETLFAWPGVGRLLVDGAIERDYFMVQAVILVLAILYAVLNLSAELLHAKLDPRIRL